MVSLRATIGCGDKSGGVGAIITKLALRSIDSAATQVGIGLSVKRADRRGSGVKAKRVFSANDDLIKLVVKCSDVYVQCTADLLLPPKRELPRPLGFKLWVGI